MNRKFLHKLHIQGHRHSLQGIILVITLIFTIFIGAVLSLLSVSFYNKYIKTGLIENADANLSFMVDSINENISEVNRLVSFCQTHSYISRFMKYTGTGSPSTALLAYDRLNDEYLVNPASDYIHRIIIGNSYDRYLQIVDATYSTSQNVAEITRSLDIYERQLASEKLNFTDGFIPDPYLNRTSRNVLILIRPVFFEYSLKQGGYTCISLREEFFTAPMHYYSMADDSRLYLTLGDHVYLMDNDALTELDITDTDIDELHYQEISPEARVFHFNNASGSGYLISKPLSTEGCYITQLISNKEMKSYIPY